MKPPFFDFDLPFHFGSVAAKTRNWLLDHNTVLREFTLQFDCGDDFFFPVSLFRDREILTGSGSKAELVFKSSGSSSSKRSVHFVRDAALYRKSILSGFLMFFGKEKFTILALLPHYLQAGESSLVYMVNELISAFGNPGSGFYAGSPAELQLALERAEKNSHRIILFGASYALLDLANQKKLRLPPGSIVIETGGMKGRGRELTRMELHQSLMEGLGVSGIHSEYGMTELLSQAWALKEGRFCTPPWMQIIITDPNSVSLEVARGETGRINIIDLANVHSCSFIATDDLGCMHDDGSFEVLGRIDHAELRGCNLLVL